MPEKEHSDTFQNSNLFPENQQQMQYSKSLIIPDNLRDALGKSIDISCILSKLSFIMIDSESPSLEKVSIWLYN
jgi:hypothetical protein